MTKSRVTRPEMLRREVEILKTVKHPNIVEIVAVYDEDLSGAPVPFRGKECVPEKAVRPF